MTPLEKMLQNAGAIRPDGSDKFFGMENVGFWTSLYEVHPMLTPDLCSLVTPGIERRFQVLEALLILP